MIAGIVKEEKLAITFQFFQSHIFVLGQDQAVK
jgi:hypothetical protein